MQNKPNSRKAKMKLSFYSTKDYENQGRLPVLGKQTQSNPILSADLSAGGLPKAEASAKADSKGAPILLCGALLSPMDS